METRVILSAYPSDCQATRIEFLDSAGGFSGAKLWKITAPSGGYCLRRWPKGHPSEEGLRFIHAVLFHVGREGCRFVPVPQRTQEGQSFLASGGYLWELAPWMPGRADFHEKPSSARLQAGLMALAQFHRATSTFPSRSAGIQAPSPGIRERLDRLLQWRGGEFSLARRSLDPAIWPEMVPRARAILALAEEMAGSVQGLLEAASLVPVTTQPCLRDVWHDHVLFEGDRVTGLIDFGSMRVESVAADIARLLGSLVLDDATGWRAGLEAYREVRGLSAEELQLIEAFDRSTVLLSGLNWIDWVYRQQRVFSSREAILARLDEILQRLHCLARARGSPETEAGTVHPVDDQ